MPKISGNNKYNSCFLSIFFVLHNAACKLTLNDNVFGCPLLVKGGEPSMLSDTHDMLFEVKILGVEAEETQPQLPHRLCVFPILWPVTRLQVETDDGDILANIFDIFKVML